MIRQMDQSEFAAFVAALWERQGWRTQVTEKSGKSFVALQREDAEGLIWATPGSSDGVSGKALQQFVTLREQYGLDEGAVVTAGRFTDDAERIADQAGIEHVDGEKLRTIVEARELHDLVREHADGAAAGDDGTADDETTGDADDEGPLDRLPAVPAKAVGGVVVALLAVVAAVVVGPTILGTGGEVQETAFDVSAASSVSGDETATLQVAWNAKATTELRPGNDTVYRPRSGQRFVLVEMNVTNAGDGTVGLRQRGFLLRANGTTHGHQPLSNASGFDPTVLGPGESTTVWTVFSVGESTTTATLVASEAVYGDVGVRFDRDANISVAV